MRVFVSYSRAEFYCAEDLALALGAHHEVDAWLDVHRLQPGDDWDAAIIEAVHAADGVVLVASRDALASPHVRAELDLAQRLDKPVVVALAERVDAPGALAGAPLVDLRRDFDGTVRDVLGMLDESDDVVPASSVWRSSSARPGVVRLVSAVLLAAALFCVLLGALTALAGTAPATLSGIVFAVGGVFSGWLWWAFSHRRPGWTNMLGVAFAFSLGCELAVAWVLLFTVDDVQPWVLGFWCVPGAVTLVTGVLALRSPSFYRWLPTGDAPRWMRRRMLARRGHRTDTNGRPAAAALTYDIRCHELDASVHGALDRALRARGHRPADGSSADRQILALSNLTPTDWLAETLGQLTVHPIVVISAPVSLEALEHLERYQWVDHRRRNGGTLERLAASIGAAPAAAAETVPESLSRRVVPFAVLALSGWWVFVAATGISTGIAGLAGADLTGMYGGPDSRLASLSSLLVGAMLLGAAMALVARRISLRHLVACVTVLFLFGIANVTVLYPDLPIAIKLPTLAVAPLVLLVCGKALARWLPARVGIRANVSTLAVAKGPWWERRAAGAFLLSTVAMTLLWLAVNPSLVRIVNAQTPEGDEQAIRETLADYATAMREKDLQALCDQILSSTLVAKIRGAGPPCELALRDGLEDRQNPQLEVLALEVDGDDALARVLGSADGEDPSTVNARLVREDDGWRLDSLSDVE